VAEKFHILADVGTPLPAVEASSARDVSFSCHLIADREAPYIIPHRDNLSSIFMAGYKRNLTMELCSPLVPVIAVQIRPAERGNVHLY